MTLVVKTLSHQPLEFLHGAGNDGPHVSINLAWGTSQNQGANGSSGITNVFMSTHDSNLRASQDDASFCHIFNGVFDFTSRTCSIKHNN